MVENQTEKVQIILRPTRDNKKNIELFIGNQYKAKVYSISLRKQITWLLLILKNIIKHTRLDA